MKKHSLSRLIGRIVLITGAIHVLNTIIDKRATDKHLLKSDSSNVFTWRGVRVHYERKGSGTPVILLHNLNPVASAYEWHEIDPLLAKNHTVYTLDLPGMGRSDKFDQPYSSFYYVEFLKEFIETMHLKGATVIASSLSSTIALMTSVYDSSLISNIVVINPITKASKNDSETVNKIKKAIMELPVIGSLIYNTLYSREQIDYWFTERALYNPFNESIELVDTSYEAAHLGHGRGRYFAAALMSGYLDMEINHILQKLSIPTLLLEGKNADDAELISEIWTSKNDQISVMQIDHTKQLPHIEEPTQIVDAIEEFLS